jgi:hypothetical protein
VLPALGSSGRELSADADLFGFGQAVTCLGPRGPAPDPTDVMVDTGSARLPGSLVIPTDAGGLVVFVRGSRANVFNVALLAARLTAITRWLRDQPGAAAVPVGYFGAGTGTRRGPGGGDRHPASPDHRHRVPQRSSGPGGADVIAAAA